MCGIFGIDLFDNSNVLCKMKTSVS